MNKMTALLAYSKAMQISNSHSTVYRQMELDCTATSGRAGSKELLGGESPEAAGAVTKETVVDKASS